jgi:hypothetical protein
MPAAAFSAILNRFSSPAAHSRPFSVIGSMLLDRGEKVWFENPGAIGARNAFIACGADLVPVAVDDEGINVADGLAKAPDFRLAFVTPSHQQPLSRVLSLSRRLALLNAAETQMPSSSRMITTAISISAISRFPRSKASIPMAG